MTGWAPPDPAASASQDEVRRLYRRRPKSRAGRFSLVAVLGLIAWSWLAGGFELGELLSAQRRANLERFLGELRPFPLQGQDFDAGEAWRWGADLFAERGFEAAVSTLAMSVAAIVLAAVGAAGLCLPAARNLATAAPFLPPNRPLSAEARLLWWFVVYLTRTLCVFLRAIPEFVWAFLFVAMFGPTAWPCVLALGLHNMGILGRLNAEAVENLEPPLFQALRALGATRVQMVVAGIYPLVLNRMLLYFFYRWETCVRDATVIGMLGIVSLGFWIQDARARNQYDTMLFFVLVGASLVILGDLLSAFVRSLVRRQG